MDGDLRQFH